MHTLCQASSMSIQPHFLRVFGESVIDLELGRSLDGLSHHWPLPFLRSLLASLVHHAAYGRGGGYFWAVAIQLFLDLGKKVFFTHILLHEAEGLIFSPLIFPQSMPMGLVPMISSTQISSLMAQVTDLGLVCWDWSPGPCAH